MGYFLRIPDPPPEVDVKRVAIAALLKFQQKHTVEVKAQFEINLTKRTVKISAGETETYTFEELGFT